MRNLVIIFTLLAFCLTSGYCQVRHIKGMKGVEINLGATGQAPFFAAGYSQYLDRIAYIKGSLGYERGTASNSDFSTYFIDAAMHYTFYSVNPNFFLNAVGGLSGMHEEIEKKEITIDQSGSSIGVLIGFEMELYIDERWVVLLNGNQRHYFSSNFGKNRWLVGAGIKRIL